jgi:hypothetical protein
MRVLITIPHYYRPQASGSDALHGSHDASTRRQRLTALEDTIFAFHALFGRKMFAVQSNLRRYLPAPNPVAVDFDIVVFTTGGAHLLGDIQLPRSMYAHVETDAEPPFLGYECYRHLESKLGDYDLFGFFEDDIVVHDVLFFAKLEALRTKAKEMGCGEILFQPQRFERMDATAADIKEAVAKIYIDYQVYPAPPYDGPAIAIDCIGRQARFEPALNPHAGCFVIDREQLRAVVRHPRYLDRAVIWVSPLSNAATGFVAQALPVYKPTLECSALFEVEHRHPHTVRQLTGAANERFVPPHGFVYVSRA